MKKDKREGGERQRKKMRKKTYVCIYMYYRERGRERGERDRERESKRNIKKKKEEHEHIGREVSKILLACFCGFEVFLLVSGFIPGFPSRLPSCLFFFTCALLIFRTPPPTKVMMNIASAILGVVCVWLLSAPTIHTTPSENAAFGREARCWGWYVIGGVR